MSSSTPAPWITAQTSLLLRQRGHAWLLHGPSGLGQYDLALDLVRAWLCASPTEDGACGHCASCHAIDVRTHPDLLVLMPETELLERNWPLAEKAQAELDEKKRKPSREIRIDAVRAAVEFSQRTSASGRGKAILVFPAERMNQISANALLKTLEEPAGDVRFVLACEAAHQLLPTIRSRCMGHAMSWPQPEEALQWIVARGVDAAAVAGLMRFAGGRPDDALQLANAARAPKTWALLANAVKRGDQGLTQDWSVAEIVSALLKLCHDLQLVHQGATPRYFAPGDLPAPAPLSVLSQWGRELTQAARIVEHPLNPGLTREALLSQARNALNSTH